MLVVALVASVTITLAPSRAHAATVERVSSGGESTMLDRVNDERTARGLVPLRMSDGARQVAREWSRSMAEAGRLSHRSGLSSIFTGDWTRLGENVGYGWGVDSLHRAFMNSTGHRANVLNRDYRWVGVGVVTTSDGKIWATFNFGAGDDTVASRYRNVTLSSPTGPFRDVPGDATFAANISWLAASGITKGCNPPTNTRFCPDHVVTRQQMASFLVRALHLPPSQTRFRDVPASSVHAGDIAALAAAGITKGCAARRFCPGQAVTRQQMASFLVRALNLPGARVGFADVPSGSTHAADIAALAAAGITKGCGGRRFCPTDPVTREQMSAFLHRALN